MSKLVQNGEEHVHIGLLKAILHYENHNEVKLYHAFTVSFFLSKRKEKVYLYAVGV